MDLSQEKEALLNIVKESLIKVIDNGLVPALEKAAKQTPTPIDDVVLAALKEPLKQALKEYIQGL